MQRDVRWINSFTLLMSGLLYLVMGFEGLGDSRYAGAGLLWGAAQVIGAGMTVVKGETDPDGRIPRVIANLWAAAFWYSVTMILVIKNGVANSGGATQIQYVDVSPMTLAVFISHSVLLAVCPLGYVWSQSKLGRKR